MQNAILITDFYFKDWSEELSYQQISDNWHKDEYYILFHRYSELTSSYTKLSDRLVKNEIKGGVNADALQRHALHILTVKYHTIWGGIQKDYFRFIC